MDKQRRQAGGGEGEQRRWVVASDGDLGEGDGHSPVEAAEASAWDRTVERLDPTSTADEPDEAELTATLAELLRARGHAVKPRKR